MKLKPVGRGSNHMREEGLHDGLCGVEVDVGVEVGQTHEAEVEFFIILFWYFIPIEHIERFGGVVWKLLQYGGIDNVRQLFSRATWLDWEASRNFAGPVYRQTHSLKRGWWHHSSVCIIGCWGCVSENLKYTWWDLPGSWHAGKSIYKCSGRGHSNDLSVKNSLQGV